VAISSLLPEALSQSNCHKHSRSRATATHDLDSASQENTFALTRFESLCDDNMLDKEMTSCAEDLVCHLRPGLFQKFFREGKL
jgi:hypothetical protein